MLHAVLGTNDCNLRWIALTEQKRLSAPKGRGVTVSRGEASGKTVGRK